MESALRPREIQTRIRAGEDPETVAAAAGTTLDRIMPFAGPVLAERAHVVDRAQRSSLRRAAGEHVGVRTLGEAVAVRLQGVDVAPDSVAWDSWRREDGRWTLTGAFSAAGRSGTARFAYDAPGNFVTCENDEARWLVSDADDAPAVSQADDGRTRRLAAVADVEVHLGDDALELVSETPPAWNQAADQASAQETTADLSETAAAVRDSQPLAAEAEEGPVPDAGPHRRPVRKTRGRASVPSWDEIMFGGRTD